VTSRRLRTSAIVIGAAGSVALAIGFALEPRQAAFSYLTAWTFAVSIALGALIFLMICHAMDARWPVVFQPFTEAIVSTLPWLAILFAPIALSLARLYAWVDPSPALGHEGLEKLAHKAAYLDPTFFVVRAVVFLVVWLVIGEQLLRRSTRRPRALSAAALPLVALTLTFASFDWLMSLTPLWFSTVYGLLFFSGGFVGAIALIAVVARAARVSPIVMSSVHPGHSGALGRVLFAALAIWAYMEFSQGIIIWIANKPDEVPWYIARGAGVWGGVFALLLIGHFAVPFFALLPREVKRRSSWLAAIAGWLLVMHYVDIYWLVMPVLHADVTLHWLDVAAPCAVLGTAVAFACLRRRGQRALEDHARDAAAVAGYEGI
jgi:hypothetical protein